MGDFEGIDSFRAFLEMVLQAFPDNQIDLKELPATDKWSLFTI